MVYNPVFVAGMAAWAAAQIIKVIINLIKGNGFLPERLIGSGGMPSAHSATVCGAATAALRVCGPDSPVFALAALMAIIVIYDAMNVRYQSGLHAAELNRLRREKKDPQPGFKNSGKDFKELLGHTPVQVAAGIVLGVVVGILIPVEV